MKGLQKILEKEELRISQIKEVVDARLAQAPDGHLRLSKSDDSQQFLLSTKLPKGRAQLHYIDKSNHDLAQKLAQKDYDEQVQKLTKQRLYQISQLSRTYADDEIEQLYTQLHPARQELVTPVEPTWEQRVLEWKNTPYTGKPFDVNTPEIYTKKGERVRSKSEKILADTFYDLGIQYKYECPIRLEGMGIVYPDFTFMSKYCNGIMYWEHDGKMDDPKYATKAIRKIDTYIKNGIFPGERLILTFETQNYTLNDAVVKELINKYLL